MDALVRNLNTLNTAQTASKTPIKPTSSSTPANNPPSPTTGTSTGGSTFPGTSPTVSAIKTSEVSPGRRASSAVVSPFGYLPDIEQLQRGARSSMSSTASTSPTLVGGSAFAGGGGGGGLASSPNVPKPGTTINPATGKPHQQGLTRAELDAIRLKGAELLDPAPAAEQARRGSTTHGNFRFLGSPDLSPQKDGRRMSSLSGRDQAAAQLIGGGPTSSAPAVHRGSIVEDIEKNLSMFGSKAKEVMPTAFKDIFAEPKGKQPEGTPIKPRRGSAAALFENVKTQATKLTHDITEAIKEPGPDNQSLAGRRGSLIADAKLNAQSTIHNAQVQATSGRRESALKGQPDRVPGTVGAEQGVFDQVKGFLSDTFADSPFSSARENQVARPGEVAPAAYAAGPTTKEPTVGVVAVGPSGSTTIVSTTGTSPAPTAKRGSIAGITAALSTMAVAAQETLKEAGDKAAAIAEGITESLSDRPTGATNIGTSGPASSTTAIKAATLPSEETQGAKPGDFSTGVGALPGSKNEAGVAVPPDVRAKEGTAGGLIATSTPSTSTPATITGIPGAGSDATGVAGLGAAGVALVAGTHAISNRSPPSSPLPPKSSAREITSTADANRSDAEKVVSDFNQTGNLAAALPQTNLGSGLSEGATHPKAINVSESTGSTVPTSSAAASTLGSAGTITPTVGSLEGQGLRVQPDRADSTTSITAVRHGQPGDLEHSEGKSPSGMGADPIAKSGSSHVGEGLAAGAVGGGAAAILAEKIAERHGSVADKSQGTDGAGDLPVPAGLSSSNNTASTTSGSDSTAAALESKVEENHKSGNHEDASTQAASGTANGSAAKELGNKVAENHESGGVPAPASTGVSDLVGGITGNGSPISSGQKSTSKGTGPNHTTSLSPGDASVAIGHPSTRGQDGTSRIPKEYPEAELPKSQSHGMGTLSSHDTTSHPDTNHDDGTAHHPSSTLATSSSTTDNIETTQQPPPTPPKSSDTPISAASAQRQSLDKPNRDSVDSSRSNGGNRRRSSVEGGKKVGFMKKLKGEMKVLSGKITNDDEKVELGERIKHGET